MSTKKPGAPYGNQNAKRVDYPRVVLSLKEDEFKAYAQEFEAQHGHAPGEDELKNLLRRAIREGKQEILHLHVTVSREHALEVRRLIERLFGQVRAISLRDSWFDQSEFREIYYQRRMDMSNAFDPDALEHWEIEELKQHNLTSDDVYRKVQEVQTSPLVVRVNCAITRSPLPERW